MTSPISLPRLHTHWTTSLLLPPTSRLSSLRRLLRTLTSSSTTVLSSTSLSLLYIDLALTYAFLGEYYLASLSFHEAGNLLQGRCGDGDDGVDEDGVDGGDVEQTNRREYQAFAFFGCGLAKAELGDWSGARREWRRCLGCFGLDGGEVLDEILYELCRRSKNTFREGEREEGDETLPYASDGGLGGKWVLKRVDVEWNLRVAHLEYGFRRKFDSGVREAEVGTTENGSREGESYGINGIPANLLFGPHWQGDKTELEVESSLHHQHRFSDSIPSPSPVEERKDTALIELGNVRQSHHLSFPPLSAIGKASTLPPPTFARTWPKTLSPTSDILAIPAGLNITTSLTPLVPPVSRFHIDPRSHNVNGVEDGDDSPTLGRFSKSSIYSIQPSSRESQEQLKEAINEDLDREYEEEHIGLLLPAYDHDPLAYYFSPLPGAREAEKGMKYWDVEINQCLYGKDVKMDKEEDSRKESEYLQQENSPSYTDEDAVDDLGSLKEIKSVPRLNIRKLSNLLGEEIPILLPRAFEGFGARDER